MNPIILMILNVINKYERDYPVTSGDISNELGIKVNVINGHLSYLEKKAFVYKKQKNKITTLYLTDAGREKLKRWNKSI